MENTALQPVVIISFVIVYIRLLFTSTVSLPYKLPIKCCECGVYQNIVGCTKTNCVNATLFNRVEPMYAFEFSKFNDFFVCVCVY